MPKTDSETRPRRAYDNTLRREQAAETRERIVSAASEILHATHVRDWDVLTVRAVAERAGVNERTVYRHFHNERGLRDAVMQRMEEEAGIDLETMCLEDVSMVAARIFRHVTSYPWEPRPVLDPTLSDANRRQHGALLKAVSLHSETWSHEEQKMAAGLLDVLWSVGAYERLVGDWHLDTDVAIQTIDWAIKLVENAVLNGPRPTEDT
jgi:AcrR family transcriptional regulator